MWRPISTVGFLAAILVLAVALAACGSSGGSGGAERDPGALPELAVGDTWTTRGPVEGEMYTMVQTVTGTDVIDGKECYVLDISMDPPMFGLIDTVTAMMDRSTMLFLEMKSAGEAPDGAFEFRSTHTYELPDEPPFPLAVGKEYTVVETETTTTTISGESDVETETNTYTYRVEAMEEVTVPAGTFQCFRVVKYGEEGQRLETSWLAPEVKMFEVKSVDHETDEVAELLSYSLK